MPCGELLIGCAALRNSGGGFAIHGEPGIDQWHGLPGRIGHDCKPILWPDGARSGRGPTLHTAFEDGDAAEDQRRHLLRLWLDVPQMRPVHPHIKSGGIEAVPGRTPSYDWSKLTSNRN